MGISARAHAFFRATSEIPNRGARIFIGSDHTSSWSCFRESRLAIVISKIWVGLHLTAEGFLGSVSLVWFAGTGCAPLRFTPEAYVHLRVCHNKGQQPVLVARSGECQWWWWQSEFYRDSADYDPIDVEALLLMAGQGQEQG